MWKAILYHFFPGLRPKPTLFELINAEIQLEQRLLLLALSDRERAEHEMLMRIARVNRLGAMIAQHETSQSPNHSVAQQPRSDLH